MTVVPYTVCIIAAVTDMKKSENVPKAMQARYVEIIQITDAFSAQYLSEEYAQLIRYLVAALLRKRPSPLAKGKAATWACGATHAVGVVNFLYDKNTDPYISASHLYKAFGVGEGTGQAKSKIIRDLLGMFQMHPEWTVPSQITDNPMTWMITVNGLIVDIRGQPREVQEISSRAIENIYFSACSPELAV